MWFVRGAEEPKVGDGGKMEVMMREELVSKKKKNDERGEFKLDWSLRRRGRGCLSLFAVRMGQTLFTV